MPGGIVNHPSYNPVISHDVDDDIAQESSDSSIRSSVRSVKNSAQMFSMSKSQILDFFSGRCSSFVKYFTGYVNDDEQPAATEVYATGEVLRRDAEAYLEEIALRDTREEEPVPHGWKGPS
ncbi:hypothetical protein SAMN05216516_11322 [Izhakiella capsodis]|uniref:Uncharacterized protein n=1 Tax=Izhakiella capsodis TaxID=1367852 RepID=A0A1I5AUB9_9GAMM|nr:hypothetical protein [Izhakiella capsodis]SFN65809.1 hypothetical protein SAMN05216516_11322 [Izhakiella capsodis]